MFITPSFTTLIPHESTHQHIASSHAPCEHKRSIPANLSVSSLSQPSIILHHCSPKPLQSNVLSQFNLILIPLHQIPSMIMSTHKQQINTETISLACIIFSYSSVVTRMNLLAAIPIIAASCYYCHPTVYRTNISTNPW